MELFVQDEDRSWMKLACLRTRFGKLRHSALTIRSFRVYKALGCGVLAAPESNQQCLGTFYGGHG